MPAHTEKEEKVVGEMRKRICALLLVLGITAWSVPGFAVEETMPQETQDTGESVSETAVEENAEENVPGDEKDDAEEADDSEQTVSVDTEQNALSVDALVTEESVPAADEAEPEEETAAGMLAMVEASTDPAQAGARDVWIDNTVDRSESVVIGKVMVTDLFTGETTTKEVYNETFSVQFSNPKTAEVTAAIQAAEQAARTYASSNSYQITKCEIDNDGYSEKVWDNRRYETIEDGDAVLIGDTDYMGGASGVDTNSTQTHVASGDYGKRTIYTVTVKAEYRPSTGFGAGCSDGGLFSIQMRIDGSESDWGTTSAGNFTFYKGTEVTLTAIPKEGYTFEGWYAGVYSQTTGFVGSGTGDLISSAAVYFFIADEEMALYAQFKAVAHTHTLVKTEAVEATCTKDGKKEYWSCSECGKIFSDEEGTAEVTDESTLTVTAKGHTWDEGKITTEPTCTETGVKTFTCTVCEEIRTETVEATGHSWDEGKITTEPTCTEAGVKTYTCSVCEETRTEEIKALDHDWSDWTVLKEATDNEAGIEVRTCKNDPSHTETREITNGPVYYRSTSGDGSSYSRETEEPLTFRFVRSVNENETFAHFMGVLVDHKAIGEADYKAEPGSVIITLTSAFLNTLEAGTHTLTAIFSDGNDVDVEFTIVGEESPEPTETPAEPTVTPAEPTETPAEPTETPVEPTETPAEPTETPAEPTETPAEPTEAPAEPTETPAEPTEAPAEPTETPAEPTETPAEPTETPVEPTEAPAEPTETPAEPTDTPKPTDTPAPTVIPANTNSGGTTPGSGSSSNTSSASVPANNSGSPSTGDPVQTGMWIALGMSSFAEIILAAKGRRKARRRK